MGGDEHRTVLTLSGPRLKAEGADAVSHARAHGDECATTLSGQRAIHRRQMVGVVRRGCEDVDHPYDAMVNVVKAWAKRGAGKMPPARAMSRPAFSGTSARSSRAGSSAQTKPRDGPTMTSTAAVSRAGT